MAKQPKSPIENAMEAFGAALSQLSGTAISAAVSFQLLDRAIGAIQSHVARFVELANPGVFNLFKLAVDNLHAAIGRALVPLLEKATQVIQAVGAAFYGLSNEGQKAVQALAAGATAIVVLTAAIAALQAIATGGLAPILTVIVGSLASVFAATVDLKPALDAFAAGLGGVFEAIGAIVSSLTPLIPSIMSIFEPFIESIRLFARTIVGTLANAGPILFTLAEVLRTVVATAQAPLNLLIEIVGSVLVEAVRLLSEVMLEAGPYIIAFARVIGDMVKFVISQIRQLMGMMGLQLPPLPEGKPVDATGAAARSVSTGSVEDVLRKARESAFAMGAGGGKKPEERTAANTDVMSQRVTEIEAWLKSLPDAMWEKFKEMPALIGKFIKDNLPSGEQVQSAATGAAVSAATNAPFIPAPVAVAAAAIPTIHDLAKDAKNWAARQLPDVF